MDLICAFVQLYPSLKIDIGSEGLVLEIFNCLFELPTTINKVIYLCHHK